jgi:hypothetical protein
MDTRGVPPLWRDRVERLTRLAIGVGAQVLPAPAQPASTGSGHGDRPGTLAVDIAIGAFARTQTVVLDATERVVAVGSAVARVPVVAGVTSGATHIARRAFESTRVRGQTVRVRAVREARTDIPQYAGRAVSRVVDIVPLNQVLDQVDLDALLERLDIDRVIRRVPIQAVIDRVDLDTVMQRVDIASLIDRVDLNSVITKLDLDALVERTDLGAVIAQSTGGMASNAVDLVRRQGVGLDELVASFAARIRQRSLRDSPPGPPLLAGPQAAR